MYAIRSYYGLVVPLYLVVLALVGGAISLTNRTHTAGVHQGAVLQDSSAYEAHPLDVFGVSEQDILLGPLSGWNVVHYFLKEIIV